MVIAEYDKDGKIVVVCFNELRRRFPHTSFCTPVIQSTLPEGYFLIESKDKPNTIRQLKEVVLVNEDGKPYVDWVFANSDEDDKEILENHYYSEIERLTKESDWAVRDEVPDFIKNKYKKYRETLWNIPKQNGFPFNIDFPEIK